MASPSLSPVAARIQSLDVLRGFAVLGILLVNIQLFAMIEAAYANPTAFGDLTGVHFAAWLGTYVLADGKFLALFSLMFGASMLLMTGRIEGRGGGAAAIHYRRMAVLALIGMAHAYALWYGDVLVSYALCGALVFLFRRLRPGRLLALGLLMLCVPSALLALSGLSLSQWTAQDYYQALSHWLPADDDILTEVVIYRSGWLDQMNLRIPAAVASQTGGFVAWMLWRAGGLMLIGMALYQWGVLTAARSDRFYRTLATAGLGLGIPLVLLGVAGNFDADWALEHAMYAGTQFNYWGSLLVAGGYIGVVMRVCRSPGLARLTAPLAAVGRTALSNYLLQSVICTAIFYGHGLGLFGAVERGWLLVAVAGVCSLQIGLSLLWLGRFRMGPVEWLWRVLTYWRRQPLLIENRAATGVTRSTKDVGQFRARTGKRRKLARPVSYVYGWWGRGKAPGMRGDDSITPLAERSPQ